MSRKLHNNARTARTACRKCSLFVLYGFFPGTARVTKPDSRVSWVQKKTASLGGRGVSVAKGYQLLCFMRFYAGVKVRDDIYVDRMRIELTTSALRTRHSPN